MDMDPTDGIEILNPLIVRNPIRMEIIENHVANAYADMPSILGHSGRAWWQALAHEEAAVAATTKFNERTRMPSCPQCSLNTVGALLTLQVAKATCRLRRGLLGRIGSRMRRHGLDSPKSLFRGASSLDPSAIAMSGTG